MHSSTFLKHTLTHIHVIIFSIHKIFIHTSIRIIKICSNIHTSILIIYDYSYLNKCNYTIIFIICKYLIQLYLFVYQRYIFTRFHAFIWWRKTGMLKIFSCVLPLIIPRKIFFTKLNFHTCVPPLICK